MVSESRLKRFPVFSRLPRTLLRRLAKSVTEEAYPAGATIFAEGRWGDALYFVRAGEVLIRKTIERRRGTSKGLTLLRPGEFFGEMALLEDAPRSASAVAHTDVSLYRLPRPAFQRLISSQPRAALEFFRGVVITLSARLRQTTREMVALFEVGRALAMGLDAPALASRILFVAAPSLEERTFGVFFHWNAFNGEFEVLAHDGPSPEGFLQPLPGRHAAAAWLAEKRECLLSSDWSRDERFAESARSAWSGCRALLAAPIFGSQGLRGILLFGHDRRPGAFTPGHRQVLAGMANLVAPAFENLAWRQEEAARRRLERSKTFVP